MNANDLATKSDLQQMKCDIISEVKELLQQGQANHKPWLRSAETMELLSVSYSQLKNLRVKGILPASKLGGIWYYCYADVIKVLEENKLDVY